MTKTSPDVPPKAPIFEVKGLVGGLKQGNLGGTLNDEAFNTSPTNF